MTRKFSRRVAGSNDNYHHISAKSLKRFYEPQIYVKANNV
jgi:hypothetical protein